MEKANVTELLSQDKVHKFADIFIRYKFTKANIYRATPIKRKRLETLICQPRKMRMKEWYIIADYFNVPAAKIVQLINQ